MKRMVFTVAMVVILSITLLAMPSFAESSKESGNSFGSFDNFPSMSGFGNDDWFSNFSTPEGFGNLNWDNFGGSVEGSSWGSLDNSAMDDFKQKFEEFKNGSSIDFQQPSVSESDQKKEDDLRSAFNSQMEKAQNSKDNSNTTSLKDTMKELFGSDKTYTGELSTPDLPVTLAELNASNPVSKSAYNSLSSSMTGSLGTLNSAMNRVQGDANSILSMPTSRDSLTDFGSMAAFKKPESKNVRALFEGNTASLSSKIQSVDVDSYASTGKQLVQQEKSNYKPGSILSLYSPKGH